LGRIIRDLALIALFAAAVSLVAFEKQEIPTFPGDGNPQHDGQPVMCQNFDTKEYKHNCACKAMNDEAACTPHDPGADEDEDEGGGESPRCKVYCRKSACFCQRHCDS
jgi:hypothetical protein